MHADLSGIDPLVTNVTHRAVIGDIPTRGAQTYGDRPAVVDGEHVLSYRALEAQANAVARGLSAHGIDPGDAVAILVQNRWEFVVTFFACAKAGVVALPLNLSMSADDVSYQLDDSQACAVVVEQDYLPLLQQALQGTDRAAVRSVHAIGAQSGSAAGHRVHDWAAFLENDGDAVEQIIDDRDILQCLYTSGTTSRPKAVVTSHVAVLIAVLVQALRLGMRPDRSGAVVPIVLPLFHVAALDALLLPVLLTGGTAILHRGFDADAVLADFANHRVTHITLLPVMWAKLLDHPRLKEVDTTTLQIGGYAMAPMPAERLHAIRAAFPQADIELASGMTEATPPTEAQWPAQLGEKDDSWGPPVPTADVRIMDHDGRLLPPGQEGEMVYRTPQLMEGYRDNADKNAEAFAHGWFHSGDIGYRDDEGVVWFTDRTKDIVKTGGENVSSIEVERVLMSHDGVAECAVVGLPDKRWGEAVTAFVVPSGDGDVDEEGLRSYCKQKLAGFKVPKHIISVDALPKTADGKVKKQELRDSYHGQD